MGRKPNTLVLDFFYRGEKLADSSNRYQHSCKRCHEFFPKGRIDSLMTHLLRRCPSITQEDRDRCCVLLGGRSSALQKSVDPQLGASSGPRAPDVATCDANDDVLEIGGIYIPQELQSELPMPQLLHREPSALDTLAEVSRRHLDYSSQRLPVGEEQKDFTQGEFDEESLMAQLQRAAKEHPAPYSATQQQDTFQAFQHTPSIHATSLMHAASAALEQEQPRQPSALDPQLAASNELPTLDFQLDGATDADPNDQAVAASAGSELTWSATNASGSQTYSNPTAIISPAYSPNPAFGLLQKPSKAKSRSRFNDERRKEVQEIRKRGACIRCRMLKKPCSDGDPCNTCRSVENARLWKKTCIRTRLADEFFLYSAPLYHSKALIEVSAATFGLQATMILPGRIEASFFPGSNVYITFIPKRCVNMPKQRQDVDAALTDGTAESQLDRKDFYVIEPGDSVTERVEHYISRTTRECINCEASPFVAATLSRAVELMQDDNNLLLKNTIDLWTATCILTKGTQGSLMLRYDPNHKPSHGPVEPIAGAQSTAKVLLPESQSQALIKQQLLAAVETYCSRLSKTVLNEVERRLLLRQQSSACATFIASVVLLNCVERMVGLFRSFDPRSNLQDPEYDVQQTAGAEARASFPSLLSITSPHNQQISFNDSVTRAANWPLNRPPAFYWQQGDSFSDLLIMLLKLRALPPKTMVDTDDTLCIKEGSPMPIALGAPLSPAQITGREQAKLARLWLDGLGLKVRELITRRDAPLPESSEGVGAWDLRFISRVLIPDKM